MSLAHFCIPACSMPSKLRTDSDSPASASVLQTAFRAAESRPAFPLSVREMQQMRARAPLGPCVNNPPPGFSFGKLDHLPEKLQNSGKAPNSGKLEDITSRAPAAAAVPRFGGGAFRFSGLLYFLRQSPSRSGGSGARELNFPGAPEKPGKFLMCK